ncbi:Aldo/keto reductase [Trichoderma citrinoviride]|uniref:Aldo/keto reductase n=1 Tax=Trichoderma citrinoviride TaxID=58853 RepID=A0A2T4B1W1_9HYPO|nr:Aldo/keto reductase [Trichoderma citrinoviride]PTB63312.1 Aldo/keto reductase [Trichoderma citrinoviride]
MVQFLGKEVGPIGFGLMGLTWRDDPPPLEQALAVMKAAVENGQTMWNGGEFYGTPEYNSMTIIKAYFTKYPEDADKVVLVMKGGIDSSARKPDGSPEGIRRSLDNILAQLGGSKKVDAFCCARRDPNYPLSVTFGVIQKEYIDTGKLGAITLSECGVHTIHEAAKVADIAGAEIELSMFTPDILKNGIAAALKEHNIPIIAYSPLGKGLLTGQYKTLNDVKKLGTVSSFPRFQPAQLEHNLRLVEQVEQVAREKGCTPGQIAINWVLSLNSDPNLPLVIPIPGSSTVQRVEENSKLVEITKEELDKLNGLVHSFEAAGERYPQHIPVNT